VDGKLETGRLGADKGGRDVGAREVMVIKGMYTRDADNPTAPPAASHRSPLFLVRPSQSCMLLSRQPLTLLNGGV
jgi:hypothetical protein